MKEILNRFVDINGDAFDEGTFDAVYAVRDVATRNQLVLMEAVLGTNMVNVKVMTYMPIGDKLVVISIALLTSLSDVGSYINDYVDSIVTRPTIAPIIIFAADREKALKRCEEASMFGRCRLIANDDDEYLDGIEGTVGLLHGEPVIVIN